jgi:hypothetical protein
MKNETYHEERDWEGIFRGMQKQQEKLSITNSSS